jgi:hypothetical protein
MLIGAVAGAVGALALVAAIVAGVMLYKRRAGASAQQLPMHMAPAGAAVPAFEGGIMPAAAAPGIMQPSGPGSMTSIDSAQMPPRI